MAQEKTIQTKLIQYLKKKGCYVIKVTAAPGVPVGCPDVIALLEGLWMAFEVKSTAKSPYQPLQKETLKKLGQWSHTRVVHKDNYDEIIAELETFL